MYIIYWIPIKGYYNSYFYIAKVFVIKIGSLSIVGVKKDINKNE
jgi:hypothetical protein